MNLKSFKDYKHNNIYRFGELSNVSVRERMKATGLKPYLLNGYILVRLDDKILTNEIIKVKNLNPNDIIVFLKEDFADTINNIKDALDEKKSLLDETFRTYIISYASGDMEEFAQSQELLSYFIGNKKLE